MRNEFPTTQLREKKIIEIKKSMIGIYIHLMSIILILYSITFFIIKFYFMTIYLVSGAFVCQLFWSILKNRVEIGKIVKLYLFLAPLYNFYIMLSFWNISVVSFVWLVPIPLGAYIFFKSKDVIFYSVYALITVLVAILVANNFRLDIMKDFNTFIRYSDIFVITSNILVVALLVYYKDKVRGLQLLSKIEERQKIIMPLSLDDKEIEQSNSLFEKIESIMQESQPFKDSKFNISVLSTILYVNNNYISKAIRLQGYSNFNAYVNTYRVNHVIHLIDTVDLEKVTLMYIYTEAGFVSQTTFNRSFKDLKGVTPTEYIQKKKGASAVY